MATARHSSHMRLGVNIDHVATVRQARKAAQPEPISAAVLAELAGADGITVHLRGDRRHIQEHDVELLRATVSTRLNVEMAATSEMIGIALRIKPHQVTLVPERADELTTTGGLDVVCRRASIEKAVERLRRGGISTSLFIDADGKQVADPMRRSRPTPAQERERASVGRRKPASNNDSTCWPGTA